MKRNILKSLLALSIVATSFVGCISEDDFEIPYIKQVFFQEGFEKSQSGSGATEIPVSIEGWVNVNKGTGTRLWGVKTYANNKYAEFSSFYSIAPETDEAWLITPEINLDNKNYALSFVSQARYYTNKNLSVWISTDFDGNPDNIQAANWQELNVTIPQSTAEEGSFKPSGDYDLSAYKNTNLRIGFKYVGSKQANQTTTYQIDNIIVFEK